MFPNSQEPSHFPAAVSALARCCRLGRSAIRCARRKLSKFSARAMSDHTVIAVQSEGPEKGLRSNPPSDYLLFSLFNILVLGNPCCLSFMALVYSVKSRDRKLAGDMNGALSYGNTSKQLNIGAIILNVLLLIVFIILFFLYVVPSIQAMYKH